MLDMKYIPVLFALSVAILYLLIGVPPSVFSKVACVALGLALLYIGKLAKNSIDPTSLGKKSETPEGENASRGAEAEPGDTPLDNDLVERILDNLRIEPSEQVREMLAQSSTGKWSPEALQAARLLLDQRLNNTAPEPVYRTVPRAAQEQCSREREATAPGFSRHLLALDVGSRVYCIWRHQSGTIIRWHDETEQFYIRCDNGEGEWANLGMFQ
jgi:hypothetical protein